jgi:hypothetical protein
VLSACTSSVAGCSATTISGPCSDIRAHAQFVGGANLIERC